MAGKKLTIRQQRYVDAFDGDVISSCKRAEVSEVYARQLHNDPRFAHVQEALINRGLTERKATILDRQALQEFWTGLTMDAKNDSDKLKASELLAKSETMFTNRTEVIHPDAIQYTPVEKQELKKLALDRIRREISD